MIRIRTSASSDLAGLHRRMEKVMETLLHGAEVFAGEGVWSPRVDIRETGDAILVTMDLPGVGREAIEVTVEGSYLHVAGVRRGPGPEGCLRWHQMEIAYGPFERLIRLPCEIDAERIRATYQDGFLSIEIPRGSAASRHVPVDTP